LVHPADMGQPGLEFETELIKIYRASLSHVECQCLIDFAESLLR